jgi:hypothetical protein
MTASGRVAAFAALLAVIFALAAIAGRATGPIAGDKPGEHAAAGAGGAAHHEAVTGSAPTELRAVARNTTLTAGRAQQFEFEIQDADGAPLRSFEVEQGRRMHFIVVRRDLRRFQHLHARQDPAGRWSVSLTLPDAGVYQAFADFQTGGERHTLGIDLFAAGRFEPLPLPAESATASADGYEVALQAPRAAGQLEFAVRRDGAAVTDLQPYLGARGHLVMLRAGDLAYEHAHPLAPDRLAFDTSAAGPGSYRLFLQFRHGDRVHTVALTRTVAR